MKQNIKLNFRQYEILETLMSKEDYISTHELGAQLNLSARIVGYNLPYIQLWLDQYDVEVVSTIGKGLLIIASQRERDFLYSLMQDQGIDTLLSSKDRLFLLLFELFIQKDYIPLHHIADILSVSKATVYRDQERAEKWLSTYGLGLNKRQKKGIRITGSEIRIRHALISLLFDIEDIVPILLKLCLWGQRINKKNKNFLQLRISEIFFNESIIDAWRYISKIENRTGIRFSDMDCIILSIYWCYMLIRIKFGFISTLPKDQIDLIKNQRLFTLVKETCDSYYKEFGQKIDDSEKSLLTLEVFSSIRAYDVLDQSLFIFTKNSQYLELVKNIFNKIGQKIGIHLFDQQISIQLANHIAKTYFCMQYGLPIKNPLSLQIKHENKLLWRITKDVLIELNPYDGLVIPDEEISFITTYIVLAHDISLKNSNKNKIKVLVVCMSGGITARVLVYRIQNRFPDIEIVGVVKLQELGMYTNENVDAIISTVYTTHRTIPVLCVSPFLNEEDIDTIKKFRLL